MSALPLTLTERHKLFIIIGLPQQNGTVAQRLVSLFGPSQDPYGFQATIDSFNTILTATTDEQNVTLRAKIAQWDSEDLDVNDTEIDSDAGTSGNVYSASRRR